MTRKATTPATTPATTTVVAAKAISPTQTQLTVSLRGYTNPLGIEVRRLKENSWTLTFVWDPREVFDGSWPAPAFPTAHLARDEQGYVLEVFVGCDGGFWNTTEVFTVRTTTSSKMEVIEAFLDAHLEYGSLEGC